MSAVYPRVCGGTRKSRCRCVYSSGLSPRVRGNQGLLADRQRRAGSIPACAGEPPATRQAVSRVGVYPRVCGGTGKIVSLILPSPGLSPRVRGNPDGWLLSRPVTGSIPACAGEPHPRGFSYGSYEVYPRVCGGTTGLAVRALHDFGLSPRVRGNRWHSGRFCLRCRSIPACAGEPAAAFTGRKWRTVYPRVCGGT